MLALLLLAGCDDDDGSQPDEPIDGGGGDAAAPTPDAGLDAATPDAGPGRKNIELKFAGRFGEQELECGRSYSGQGTGHSEVTPKDFRFYVQSVKLKTSTGDEVPLELDAPAGSSFQTKDIGLIDFTTTGGECEGGPTASNTVLKGTVPSGLTFNGVQVVIGVPQALNHADPVLAPAPLQAPGASWDWVAGYRFLIAEVLATSGHDAGTPSHGGGMDAGAGHGGGHGDADDAGAGHGGAGDAGGGHGGHGSAAPGLGFVHLGSTGCTKSGDQYSCTRPNRAEFTLTGFDPDRDTIVADLGAIFATSDLSDSVQCHGSGPSCAPMFQQLGVDIESGAPNGMQKVFSVSSR